MQKINIRHSTSIARIDRRRRQPWILPALLVLLLFALLLWTTGCNPVKTATTDADRGNVTAGPTASPTESHTVTAANPEESDSSRAINGDDAQETTAAHPDAETTESISLFGDAPSVTLPAGWTAAADTSITAEVGSATVTVPAFEAFPAAAAGDAALTVIQTPRLGLTLADYVELVRLDLEEAEGATVLRAGVVYGEAEEGRPIGEVAYEFTAALSDEAKTTETDTTDVQYSGRQFVVFSATDDTMTIFTFTATDETFQQYVAETAGIVQQFAAGD